MAELTTTPGPWRTHLDTYVEAGDNDIVAKVETRRDFQEQKGNQRLMAAAPALYDALLSLVNALETRSDLTEDEEQAHAEALRALAKAEGKA